MLVLTEIRDTVPILPPSFNLPTHVAIDAYLHKKYADKILQNVGYCMAVWDVIECGDGKVRWGDGAVWYKVKFNLLVFQPFDGEVFVGRVIASTPDRIRVSVGFFDDIYILRSSLPSTDYVFDPDDPEQEGGAYHWLMESDEEGGEKTKLHILNGDLVRVRVTASRFQEHEPGPPRDRAKIVDGVVVYNEERDDVLPGYILEVSITEQGLGVLEWWPADETGEEEEGGEAMETDE